MRRCVFGLALACVGCWPLIAAAEDCDQMPRARAAVLGAASVNSGETTAAVAGSFGYRLNRCFGLELEIGVVPDLNDDPQVVPLGSLSFDQVPVRVSPAIFPPPTFDSRLITFMTNARAEIPTTLRSILPYVVGGGGIASVKRDVSYLPYITLPDPRVATVLPPVGLLPITSTSTDTALALNVGAGVSVRLVKELFADAEMRYVRVFTTNEFDLNRFGAGVSYRF